jgi:hypothetical protein
LLECATGLRLRERRLSKLPNTDAEFESDRAVEAGDVRDDGVAAERRTLQHVLVYALGVRASPVDSA